MQEEKEISCHDSFGRGCCGRHMDVLRPDCYRTLRPSNKNAVDAPVVEYVQDKWVSCPGFCGRGYCGRHAVVLRPDRDRTLRPPKKEGISAYLGPECLAGATLCGPGEQVEVLWD